MNTVFFSAFFQSTLNISKCDIKDFLQIGAPVILTVITIILSIGMHYGNKKLQQQLSDDNDKLQKQLAEDNDKLQKQLAEDNDKLQKQLAEDNDKLQKQLADRYVENQTRELYIDIFNVLECAQNYAGSFKDVSLLLAFNGQKGSPNDFFYNLYENYQKLENAYSKFNLLSEGNDDDEKMNSSFYEFKTQYKELVDEISKYLSNPLYQKHNDSAWQMAANYGIQYPDFNSILLNIELKNAFVAKFDDDYIRKIKQLAEKVCAWGNDEDRRYFINHIKIKKYSDTI